MTLQDEHYYVQGVAAGDKRVIAKTITLIESSLAQHQAPARQVINSLLPTHNCTSATVAQCMGYSQRTLQRKLAKKPVKE